MHIHRILALVALLILPAAIMSQNLPTPYLPSFTSAPDAVTFFEYDIPDSAFYSPSAVYQLFYRNSGSTA